MKVHRTFPALSVPPHIFSLMTTAHAVRALRTAPFWRNVGLSVFGFFSLTVAVAYADARASGAPPHAMPVIGWCVGFALLIAMWWRHRWPAKFTFFAVIAAVVFPIDGFLPLVGLYAVLLVCTEEACIAGGLAAYAAVSVSIWRDSAGHGTDSAGNSTALWRTGANPTGAHYPIWLVMVIAAFLVGITIALGLLGRSRRELRHSHTETQLVTEQVGRLGEQVTRQQERERIAQEVHDVLGHRLSLLSVHAGALEVAAGDDPDLTGRARLVRESAQQSMNDLRSLIGVLRDPGDSEQRQPMRTLADLPALVDECLEAGSPVASSIFVDRSQPLDPLVSHSAFRIVQELLTNARKHAPGSPIRLKLNGHPQTGIEITTSNAAPRAIPGRSVQLGRGLTGIDERAHRSGGESHVWLDDSGVFHTHVLLPWTRPQPEDTRGR